MHLVRGCRALRFEEPRFGAAFFGGLGRFGGFWGFRGLGFRVLGFRVLGLGGFRDQRVVSEVGLLGPQGEPAF